jgi:hypothetical protein
MQQGRLIPRFKTKDCVWKCLGYCATRFAKNDNVQVFAQPDAFLVVLLRFGDGELGV